MTATSILNSLGSSFDNMKNLSILTLLAILLVSCAPVSTAVPVSMATDMPTATFTPVPTATFTPVPTATFTPVPTATFTPKPTATPIPEVDVESFVFPYDVPQVVAVWDQLKVSSQYKYFTYHISERLDKSISPNEPCGYHPGGTISPIGSTKPLNNFVIDVKIPYSGKLKNDWTPGGGGEAFTFYIGVDKGKQVYLDMYHTTSSSFLKTEWVIQGKVFGVLSETINYGGWNEAKVHFTLFNPSSSGSTDLRQGATAIPLAPIALPPTLKAMYEHQTKLLIVYEGQNWCTMKSAEKISTILNEYLPSAGFCVDGSKVSYCGENDLYQGITFNQAQYDARSIMLTPININK